MKFSDGIFHKVFDEIAKEYPQIENNHYIIDIGSAKLANKPELFDVIVTSNLYGDIISDIVAEVSGSVGLAGSANIGSEYAMFEAIHGSAPDIAGQDIANPSGLLHGAIMMLVHIGQGSAATNIHNAWLCTIEEGIHTPDIYNPATSSKKVGTKEFAAEVVKRFGKKPQTLKPVYYPEVAIDNKRENKPIIINTNENRQLVGVDVFLCWDNGDADILASKLQNLTDRELKIQAISCMGLTVWPSDNITGNKGFGDHWRIRFVPNNEAKITSQAEIIYILEQLNKAGFDFIKTENLYGYDGKPGFSLGQGE
jgi:isocitrate dehydrogenase